MVCKQCGKNIQGDPVRCPHCDAVLKETVSLGTVSHAAAPQRKKKKKKLSGSDLALRIALISVSVLAVLAILAALVLGPLLSGNAPGWLTRWMDKHRPDGDTKFNVEEQGDLNINTALPTKDIQNIALLGLDERGETDETVDGLGNGKSFHSDAIIILTVDRRDPDNVKVKLSSIARDTLVYVEGYNSKGSLTKITHAFDYGYRKAKRADTEKKLTEADYKREGAKTAIKTINQNFNMNITEYVYVNFVEFMDIIDYVGGVTINVQQKELNELNKHVYWMEQECNRDIDKVQKAGEQTLSGGQALAYARIRKIDSDLKRANRQRDVLEAVFDKVKTTAISKMPDLVSKLLGMCHTTLTSEEIVELGVWAVTKNPEIVNYTMPDTGTELGYSWIWEGTHPTYGWVWIYDLNYATALLHDFIYDTDTVQEQPRPTLSNEPKVTKTTTTTTTTQAEDPIGSTTDTGVFVDPTGDPLVTGDPTGTGDPTATDDPTGYPTVTGDPTGDPTATDVVGPIDPTDTQSPVESTTAPTFDTPETTAPTTAPVMP